MSEVTAPLVLIPFEPLQVILPGKVTTLEFKNGKLMDIIYDAIETSDLVIGPATTMACYCPFVFWWLKKSKTNLT